MESKPTIFQNIIWDPGRSLPLTLLCRRGQYSRSERGTCKSFESNHVGAAGVAGGEEEEKEEATTCNLSPLHV